MINEELLVEKLLIKYRFTEPVPVEYRKHIAASKKNNLIHLLKKNRNYSFALWGAIIVYMSLRKLGIAVSFFQATVISGVTATAVAVTVTAGSVKAVSVVKEKIDAQTKTIIYEEEPAQVLNTQSGSKSAALMKFTGTHGVGDLSDRATLIFADTLRKELGENNLSFGKSDTDKKYIITGSVEKLPEGYLLTARVIEKSSSVVIHMDMEEISDERQLSNESRKMAGKLAGMLK